MLALAAVGGAAVAAPAAATPVAPAAPAPSPAAAPLPPLLGTDRSGLGSRDGPAGGNFGTDGLVAAATGAAANGDDGDDATLLMRILRGKGAAAVLP